jgi:hypothetical protein
MIQSFRSIYVSGTLRVPFPFFAAERGQEMRCGWDGGGWLLQIFMFCSAALECEAGGWNGGGRGSRTSGLVQSSATGIACFD